MSWSIAVLVRLALSVVFQVPADDVRRLQFMLVHRCLLREFSALPVRTSGEPDE